MDESSLLIDVETFEVGTVVSPQGDIDLSKSNDLRAVLKSILDSPSRQVVVDLHAVPYMDSSGLATLIEAMQIAKMSEVSFCLCSLTQGVRSIIELARLDQIFTIHETRDCAIGT